MARLAGLVKCRPTPADHANHHRGGPGTTIGPPPAAEAYLCRAEVGGSLSAREHREVHRKGRRASPGDPLRIRSGVRPVSHGAGYSASSLLFSTSGGLGLRDETNRLLLFARAS